MLASAAAFCWSCALSSCCLEVSSAYITTALAFVLWLQALQRSDNRQAKQLTSISEIRTRQLSEPAMAAH